jgi:alkanesulfonate monooxygenase SsuD/methylene tetrahydromethanopterin reductase-like flavin-dependent oxidoreductase (luciferase family)
MQRHDGFGITAAPRRGLDRLGEVVESLGYAELWANDTQAGSGLAALAAAGVGARKIELCVGVIGLSDHAPAEIAEGVERLDLPVDRLVLGVGSGSSRSLALVEEGVADLRQRLPGVRIGVAAVGPRMLRLAGRVADVVLINWAAPARLAESRERVAAGARQAGRDVPRVAAYVRVAVGDGATRRLASEVSRYAARGPAYARQFAEQGSELVGVACEDPALVPAALAPYRAVLDSCVVRGLPAGDEVADWLTVAAAAAPADAPRATLQL